MCCSGFVTCLRDEGERGEEEMVEVKKHSMLRWVHSFLPIGAAMVDVVRSRNPMAKIWVKFIFATI